MNYILHGRYKFVKEIGRGSFGSVWLCFDNVLNDEVAIKVENVRNADKKISKGTNLLHEFEIHETIGDSKSVCCAMNFTSSGAYDFLVMERLDFSLEQLFKLCNKKFSLQTVLLVADQTIAILKDLHGRGVVHRDIKPENFMISRNRQIIGDNYEINAGNEKKIGCDKSKFVFKIIDLGLAETYLDARGRHMPFRDKCETIGNARFASLNNHLGVEQSRRDDLEGLAYMLVYFLKGSLPWTENIDLIQFQTQKQKIKFIGKVKMTTSIDSVCSGTPPEFSNFLRSIRNLRYDEAPDYDGYREAFQKLYIKEGFGDPVYDWENLESFQSQIASLKSHSNIAVGNDKFNEKIRIDNYNKVTNPMPRITKIHRNKAKSNPQQTQIRNLFGTPRLKHYPLITTLNKNKRQTCTPTQRVVSNLI